MKEIRYNLKSVKEACKTLPSRSIRTAIPKDGSDSREIRMSYVGADPNPGHRTVFGLPVKYQVSVQTEKTADGDWWAKIHWSILGKAGTFPAVVDYLDKPVLLSARPTFFPNEEQAKECGEKCADILRAQIAELFHN